MRKESIISKGKYAFPQAEGIISVKQYFFVRDENGNKKLLLRFFNTRNETCTGLSFVIHFLDSRGRVIDEERFECKDVSIDGKSAYAHPEAIFVSEKCTSFKLDVESASYGSYKYNNDNGAVSVEYKEEEPSVAKAPKRAPRTGERKIKARAFKLPWIYAIISLLVLTIAVAIVGGELYLFKDSEWEFSLDGIEYEFVSEDKENGEVVITGCSSKYTSILIPSEIEGNKVVGIDDGAFEGNSKLRAVRIEGVDIGEYTFRNCYSLEEVQIEGVSEIGTKAFENCYSLKNLTIEAGDSEEILSIGKHAFAECTALKSVTIDQLAIYRNNYEIFKNDYKIESLKLKNFAYTIEGREEIVYETTITNLITEFSYYNSYIALKEISIENIDSIYNEFCRGLSSLESFEITGSEVSTIGNEAFYGCESLASVKLKEPAIIIGKKSFFGTKIKSFNATKASTIGDEAFYNCSELSSFNLGGNKTLDAIGTGAFTNCVRLESIVLPGTVKSIGAGAFKNTGLKTFSFTNEKLIIEYGMLEGCQSIEELDLAYLPGGYVGYIFGCNDMENLSLSIPKSLKEITISGAMEALSSHAFAGCTGLKTVNLPNGIKVIGDHAFYDCKSLVDVNLGDSIEAIGEYAFAYTSIGAITIPESMAVISEGTFKGCTSLASVTTHEGLLEVSKDAFFGCESLTSIDLYNTIIIGDNAFAESGLIKIEIPTDILTLGEAILADCNSIEEITVPLYDVSYIEEYFSSLYEYSPIPDTLTKITINKAVGIQSGAFAGCYSVEEIVLCEGIITVGSAFDSCHELRKLILPKTLESFEPSSTYYCTKLYEICNQSETVEILAGVGAGQNSLYVSTSIEGCAPTVVIDGYTFSKYNDSWYFTNWENEIIELSLPNEFTYSYMVEDEEITETVSAYQIPHYLFVNDDKIEKISLPKAVSSLGTSAFNSAGLIKEIIFDKDATVEEIGASCFAGCTSVEKLILPSSVKFIGNNAFRSCYKLKSISLSNELLQIGESAFDGCELLESIVLYEKVEMIGAGAFSGCKALYDVYNLSALPISEGSESYGRIARNAFVHTDINAPLSEVVTVSGIGNFRKHGNEWMLLELDYTCKELNTATISYNGASFDEIRILANAASSRTELESLIIGNNVTQIHEGAFASCIFLRTVSMGANSKIETIEKEAFSECERMVSLTLPANLVSIGREAFEYCGKLLSVTLPQSLTYIGSDAFYGCNQLYEVYDLSPSIFVGKDYSNGYVGYYSKVILTSQNDSGLERYITNGLYFVRYNGELYLHHYVGNSQELIVVPNTSEKITIMKGALYGSNASSAVLPESVKLIEYDDDNSANLQTIYYLGNYSRWLSVECYIYNYQIYCYSSCVHDYGSWTYNSRGEITTDYCELEWGVETQPTCQSAGMKVGKCKCSGCTYYESQYLPVVDHEVVNEKCIYCGTKFITLTSANMNNNKDSFEVILYNFDINEAGKVTSLNKENDSSSSFTIVAKSRMEITLTYGVSSESSDHFAISKNGIELYNISGYVSSRSATITLYAGDVLTFSYVKDASVSMRDDCGYAYDIKIKIN